MTNKDLNPLTWSVDLKALMGLGALICTIVGGVWQAENYIGNKIYVFAQSQTQIVEHIQTAERSISTLLANQDLMKKDLQTEHSDASKAAETAKMAADAASRAADLATQATTQLAKDLQDGRARTLPRIDKLEDAISSLVPVVARIEQYAKDTEAITQSHDADIKATRNAVAPKIDGRH